MQRTKGYILRTSTEYASIVPRVHGRPNAGDGLGKYVCFCKVGRVGSLRYGNGVWSNRFRGFMLDQMQRMVEKYLFL